MSNAYQTPGADVTQAPPADPKYMGFWMRVLASILDNIWLGVLIFIVLLVVMLILPMEEASTEYLLTSGAVQIMLPAVLIISLWIRYASTPGKMAFKGRIVDADTLEPVSSGRLVLRYVSYFVSVVTLFLGFMWVGWDKRKQGFHDKIARTVVIIEN